MSFQIQAEPISTEPVREKTLDPAAGGFASFEGWVRNHHDGKEVLCLEYEAYTDLAVKEGDRIVGEAMRKFEILHCSCVHRTGRVEIGQLAVFVCVSAAHRDPAFAACRYVIDELKRRLPIWKKEFYADGETAWIRCNH